MTPEEINDRCLMCLSSNICTDKIKKECQGHFILDRGASYYHQVMIK